MALPSGSYRLTKTRHFAAVGIAIGTYDGKFWQHIDTNGGAEAQVGPQYATKAEALADHERYINEFWVSK